MERNNATETLKVEIISDYGLLRLKNQWCALESLGNASVFQSWAWISCWLSVLPEDIHPLLVRVSSGAQALGLGFVCKAKVKSKFGKANAFFLSETGKPNLDCVAVEHNGLLCDPAYESQVILQVGHALRERNDWDEWVLSGIDSTTVRDQYEELAMRMGWMVHEFGQKPWYSVDLAAVKPHCGRLEWLSANTRSQVRRALKEFGKRGEIRFELAGSVDEAFAFFERLKYFHQRYWQARGKPGAFGSEFFEIFHRRFIQQGWSGGAVQLARVSIDDYEIGYLYNLIHEQTVYSYQSGFNYENNAKIKPGLVSHVLAIERALADGFDYYDLLAGDGQYKRSLATNSENMHWIRLRRPRLAFRLEALARKVHDRSRERFEALFVDRPASNSDA